MESHWTKAKMRLSHVAYYGVDNKPVKELCNFVTHSSHCAHASTPAVHCNVVQVL